MSALARHYKHEGWLVRGSDVSETELTTQLTKEGIEIVYSQERVNVTEEIDLVVYTEAIASDNEELQQAKQLGLTTKSYFEALAEVANQYYLIAVAGTHGKSTTTAMLVDIFEEAGLDPTAVIGTLRSKSGSNYRAGRSKYMIVEACEYKRDFRFLEPDILVITNLEYEHVDYYKDLADVQRAFAELASKVPVDGYIITDSSNATVQPALENVNASVIDYRTSIDPLLQLPLPGVHNQLNAATALATAQAVGIEEGVAKKVLENFAGVWRRFEFKGLVNNAPLYDDYAHHPTEIEASIAGAREKHPDKKLLVVFKPHTFSRTRELFDEFVTSLAKADEVLVLPIYPARDEDTTGISSQELVEALIQRGIVAEFLHTHEGVVERIKRTATIKDVVVVMGAGDVTDVARDLLD